jgi:hypothetical protein
VTDLISTDREELIRLRAENEALHTLLEEVRISRDRTVEAESDLRRILAMITFRGRGITGPGAEEPEAIEAPEPPRRWWQRRRLLDGEEPEGHDTDD